MNEFYKKDLFDKKDLNFEINKFNKRSSYGEDKIHNTSQEFSKIILFLIIYENFDFFTILFMTHKWNGEKIKDTTGMEENSHQYDT